MLLSPSTTETIQPSAGDGTTLAPAAHKSFMLSPELRLLTECVRWPRTPAQQTAVRAAADAVNWQLFLAATRRHRISALALDGLRDANVAIPNEILAYMRHRAGAGARAVLIQIAEISAIDRLFKEKGIPYSVLKGLPLSATAFGDPAMRQSRDIDILVAPGDMIAARAAMIMARYAQTEPLGVKSDKQVGLWLRFHKDLSLRHPRWGTLVELHARVSDNKCLLPMQGPTEGCEPVMLAPGIKVQALQGDALILYLCVHGAHHAWFRLKWLADIAALVSGYDAARLTKLRAHAHDQGLGIILELALLLLEDVFEIRLHKTGRPLTNHSLRLRLLRSLSRRMLTEPRDPNEIPLAGTKIISTHLLFRLEPRYLLHELISLTVDWPFAVAQGLSARSIATSILLRPLIWPWRKFQDLRQGTVT